MNSYFEADSETREKLIMFAKGYSHGFYLLAPCSESTFYKDGYMKGINDYFENRGNIQE